MLLGHFEGFSRKLNRLFRSVLSEIAAEVHGVLYVGTFSIAPLATEIPKFLEDVQDHVNSADAWINVAGLALLLTRSCCGWGRGRIKLQSWSADGWLEKKESVSWRKVQTRWPTIAVESYPFGEIYATLHRQHLCLPIELTVVVKEVEEEIHNRFGPVERHYGDGHDGIAVAREHVF